MWVSRGKEVGASSSWEGKCQWIAGTAGSALFVGCLHGGWLPECAAFWLTPACKRRCSRCCHQSCLNPYAGAKNLTNSCCPLSTGTRTMAMWWGAILCPLPPLPHLLLAGYALHVRRSSFPAASYRVIVVSMEAHRQMVTSAG